MRARSGSGGGSCEIQVFMRSADRTTCAGAASGADTIRHMFLRDDATAEAAKITEHLRAAADLSPRPPARARTLRRAASSSRRPAPTCCATWTSPVSRCSSWGRLRGLSRSLAEKAARFDRGRNAGACREALTERLRDLPGARVCAAPCELEGTFDLVVVAESFDHRKRRSLRGAAAQRHGQAAARRPAGRGLLRIGSAWAPSPASPTATAAPISAPSPAATGRAKDARGSNGGATWPVWASRSRPSTCCRRTSGCRPACCSRS